MDVYINSLYDPGWYSTAYAEYVEVARLKYVAEVDVES